MIKPTKVKLKEVSINEVYFNFNYRHSPGTDIFDEDNDNDHRDTIKGTIEYFDCEAYDEDGIEDYKIGEFECDIVYGDERKIFNTIEYGGSITDVQYQSELFDIKYTDRGIGYRVRDEYVDLFPEVYENKIMLLDKIEINDLYRGHGIGKKLITFLERTFNCPIVLKPYPLQYEGKGMDKDKEFNKDLKKVVNAYKKCGFKKVRRGSEFMVKF
jgi:GNAT superfamily N-acetyltransferase